MSPGVRLLLTAPTGWTWETTPCSTLSGERCQTVAPAECGAGQWLKLECLGLTCVRASIRSAYQARLGLISLTGSGVLVWRMVTYCITMCPVRCSMCGVWDPVMPLCTSSVYPTQSSVKLITFSPPPGAGHRLIPATNMISFVQTLHTQHSTIVFVFGLPICQSQLTSPQTVEGGKGALSINGWAPTFLSSRAFDFHHFSISDLESNWSTPGQTGRIWPSPPQWYQIALDPK